MRKWNGTAVNIDDNLLYHIYRSCDGDLTNFEETLRCYIRGYAGKGISDLFLNCCGLVSVCPTKALTWAGDKYHVKEENGIPVDYSDDLILKCVAESYANLKRDPFEIMLEEAKAQGMNGWLSVRMNDIHNSDQETLNWRGDISYEALNRGMIIGKEVAGDYFAKCLDFSYEYIREKKFAYICELLDFFDMDGIELDFQREIFCFNYLKNPDCHKIMTEFMEKVKAYVQASESKRGHAIKICVRVNPSVEDNKVFGMDVAEWVHRGLLDVLVPTGRFECTDSTMDISKWKELVRGTSVKIYAGIEMSVYFPAYQSIETIKGFASQYFDTGECFNKKMTFFLGVNKGQSSPTVYVDGKNAPCLGETTDTYAQNAKMLIPKQNRYEAMDFYAYKIEATAGNKREIIVNGNHILLQYVEIKVES